ncbi:hypothetical protein ABZT03_33875 [Streptomyces sp. NPDC005574]|uniref:hypothetical protein n=1 Tax=Streptomyces sp. NPDC005574 TaxID=3156891 RepID=UPI0033A8B6A0
MSLEIASTTGGRRTSAASAVVLLLLAAALTGCHSSNATKKSATSGALRAAASGCPKTRGDFVTAPGRVASPARLGRLSRLDKAVAPGRRPARFDITVTNPTGRTTRRASLAFTISGPQRIPTFSGGLQIHYRDRWCEIATQMQNESEDSPSLSAAIPLTLDPRSSTVLHFRLSGSRPTPGSHFEDVVGYTVEVNLLATRDVRGHQLHFDLAPDSTTRPMLSSASPS